MTTPLVGGTIGQQLDLLIKQGSDFFLDVQMDPLPGEAPVDLSLYTYPAYMRKSPGAIPVCTISVTQFSATTLRIFIAHADTAILKCGADLDDDASQYVWDCEAVETATGLIAPVFFGDSQVFRDIGP